MRILVTAEDVSHATGGGRTGILGICKALKQRGHHVVLYATTADGTRKDEPSGARTSLDGVDVYFFPAHRLALGYELSLPMMKALRAGVPQSDLVLIHSLYRFTPTVAAYYCRRHGIPYVLRPHGALDPFLVYRRRRLLKWAYINLFERRNFNAAAAVQYSSRYEEDMTRSFITVTSPSLVIPEGISLETFANLPARGAFRARYPQLSGKVVILFLGRFHQKKGLELLIDAFARTKSRTGDAHLVLAGSGEADYVERISRKVRDAGLVACVTMTGQLTDDEKLQALVDVDLFVLPSFGENFGLAVVEAMASGVPVIISDKVGISPDIAEAQAGMVTPCDAQPIADALDRLVYDREWRTTLSGRGAKLVDEQFSMERMGERMDHAYRALCAAA